MCPTQHWMSIWHSHGHTRRNARTSLHTQGQLRVITPAPWEGRTNWFLPARLLRVVSDCFSSSSNVFKFNIFCSGCRGSRNRTEMPVFDTEAHTTRRGRETMLSDILESVAFVSQFIPPQCFLLFVFSPDVSQRQIEIQREFKQSRVCTFWGRNWILCARWERSILQNV